MGEKELLWSVDELSAIFLAVQFDLKNRYGSFSVDDFITEVLKTMRPKKRKVEK